VSLGGVESLICSPAKMTHGSLSARERAALGVDDDLLRLSVGIEDCADLLDDLEAALDATAVASESASLEKVPSSR
jgi:cystathionine beta-lyase/cystathionine gamma-synthase